jgi:hypothetical protein
MLNQHPMIHASTTSPVVDLLDIIHKEWPRLSSALLNQPPTQYNNIIAGMITGAYGHIDKQVIVDKNRIWPRYGKMMGEVLGHRPKIICTVRHIPEVLASYILLIEKNNHKITYIDQDIIDLGLPINNKNRCKILWEKYISAPYTSLRVGYNSNAADLCIVRYADIVDNSQVTMDRITQFIGIESHTVDQHNLQAMDENDSYHGGLEGLHNVRQEMKRVSPPPVDVIGHELTKLYTDMKLDFWNK